MLGRNSALGAGFRPERAGVRVADFGPFSAISVAKRSQLILSHPGQQRTHRKAGFTCGPIVRLPPSREAVAQSPPDRRGVLSRRAGAACARGLVRPRGLGGGGGGGFGGGGGGGVGAAPGGGGGGRGGVCGR